jgi:hypothetical protein
MASKHYLYRSKRLLLYSFENQTVSVTKTFKWQVNTQKNDSRKHFCVWFVHLSTELGWRKIRHVKCVKNMCIIVYSQSCAKSL